VGRSICVGKRGGDRRQAAATCLATPGLMRCVPTYLIDASAEVPGDEKRARAASVPGPPK